MDEEGGNPSNVPSNDSGLAEPLLDESAAVATDTTTNTLTRQDESENKDVSSSAGEELYQIAYLAVGIFLANASWVIVKTTDTALLGVSNKYIFSVISFASRVA